jgi:serine/threonine protein kinase
MSAEQSHLSAGSSDTPTWVLDLLLRFEAAWQQSPWPAVEQFLPAEPSQRWPSLVPLLVCDLERRLRQGQPLRVEDYLRRFPELAQDEAGLAELVAVEYEQLRGRPGVVLADYLQRFPGLENRLRERFPPHEERTAPGPLTSHSTLPPVGDGASDSPTLPPLRYKPVQFHAQGALGEVLLAQDEELHRSVALKRIQGQYADDPASRRRFLREAEVTGRLEHPGVVPVYGMGQDGEGRPCYAMRFIQGESLKDAIQRFHAAEKPGRDPGERRLALRQLLTSFVTVCKTMAYAHSRGVLHRDLKPANIMLGKYGETLVVDWGLARHFQRDETAHSLGEESLQPRPAGNEGETQLGQTVGTPAYCSPEQASGQWDVVGPASDIFSLGVVLYNLLTNHVPYRGPGVLEIIAQASTGEVIPPRQRHKDVPRSLEAICLKAMTRQPDQRYGTGLDLAADVEHWLADEPVQAYREPLPVRAGRWLRKHRPLVAGLAAAAAVGLVSLTIVLVVLASKNGELQGAYEREAARVVQIEKSNEILTAIFRDLDIRKVKEGPDPLEAVLAKRLVKAGGELQGQAVGEPLMVAGLQDRLGLTLLSLGYAPEAIPLLQQAWQTRQAELGADDPATLHSMNNLAGAYEDAGKLDLALSLHEETLRLTKAKLGADDPATLTYMDNLAGAYRAAGKLDLALPLHEETLKLLKAKLGADNPSTLISMGNLASAYQDSGKLHLALPLREETLRLTKAKLGADHPYTLISMNNLASAYQTAGKLDLALPLHEETLKLRRAKLGADHPDTLTSMNNLALGYKAAGKLDLALSLLQETLKLRKAKLGADHPNTLASMNNLASACVDAGKLDLALPLLEETLKLKKAKLGAEHPDTLASMNNLASGYQAAGKLDLAVALCKETLKLQKAKLGADHPDTLASMNNLASGYQAAGKLDLALPLFQEAVAGMQKRRFQHQLAAGMVHNLIRCHERLKQLDQAERWQRQWLALVKDQAGPDSLAYADELAGLGSILLKQQQWTGAEAVLRDSLAIRAKQQADTWTTCNAQSLLGAALLAQKKYTEAEPLLVGGYEGLKQRQAKIPAKEKNRLTEALERLVQFCEATGKKDESAKWRKELEAGKAASNQKKQG